MAPRRGSIEADPKWEDAAAPVALNRGDRDDANDDRGRLEPIPGNRDVPLMVLVENDPADVDSYALEWELIILGTLDELDVEEPKVTVRAYSI